MILSDAFRLNRNEEVVRASEKMGMANVLCPLSFGMPRRSGKGLVYHAISRLAVCIWSANLQVGSDSEAGINPTIPVYRKASLCFPEYKDWRRISFAAKQSLHVKRTKFRCVKLELDPPIHWSANHRKRPTFIPPPNKTNIETENI